MSFSPKLNSITTRLILFGMSLFIIGALGRIFLLTDYLRKDITELASSQLLTLANYVAQDVDRDIVARRELLVRVAAKFPLPLLAHSNPLQIWLAERQEVNPLFSSGMFVLDTAGVGLTGQTPERTGYVDRDYFQQALSGEFAIGRPVMDQFSGAPILPMAMPLRDGAGKVQAVLVGMSALRLPSFMGALYSTHVGTSGGLLLISPHDKLFVGASDASMILKPTPNEGVSTLYDQAMQGFRGVGVGVGAAGNKEVTAFASVPSSGWFVVAHLPAEEAYAPVNSLREYFIEKAAITLPIFLLVMLFVMRHVMRPLTNAAQHADRMMLGEIPLQPLPVVRSDEVGHLTTAFNRVLSKMLEKSALLEHIAHHDTLTGLPNRQLLADRMTQVLARAQRSREQVAVLCLDLDGFKPINDGLGHEAGDVALCEVAERLGSVIRRADTLARVGGDEFVILLSDLHENSKDAVELVAKKCLDVFLQPFSIRDQECRLGVSIGIAMGSGECSPDKLLIAADRSMYRAKVAGRGQFCWADECVLCADPDKESFCLISR